MASPKEILEGKPLRSPLHPALVHLPVALFPISLVLDGASWWLQGAAPGLVRGAFGCLVAGLVTGVLAAIFGVVDFSEIRRDHPARKTALRHMWGNLVALGVFSAGAYLRWPALDAMKTAVAPLVLAALGVLALVYSGYRGGEMVYNDGIGVGRHRRRTPVPRETITRKPARRPDTGLIAVAEEGALKEGETLRVDVMGTVMTIACAEGALYAVQEFCTHRYGPLSEGKLRGCEIVCPWHSSHFDLRSGQPTSGPATVGLRTFAWRRARGRSGSRRRGGSDARARVARDEWRGRRSGNFYRGFRGEGADAEIFLAQSSRRGNRFYFPAVQPLSTISVLPVTMADSSTAR